MSRMLKATMSLIAGVLFAAGWITRSFGQNNELMVEQIGDRNTATVSQVGQSNTITVFQKPLAEEKTFGDNFANNGTFVKPVLDVDTKAGNENEGEDVLEKDIPANLNACASVVIDCREVSGEPIDKIVLAEDSPSDSRTRVLQDNGGNESANTQNTVTAKQYGSDSQSVILQGSASRVGALDDFAALSGTDFSFSNVAAGANGNLKGSVGDFVEKTRKNARNNNGNGSGNGNDVNGANDNESGNGFEVELEERKTLTEIMGNINGTSGAVKDNTAMVVQSGGNNRSLAIQSGQHNDLLTVQDGNDKGLHIQTNDGNNTRLLQGDGANINALIARGGVTAPGGGQFTLQAQGGVNFGLDLEGEQNFSGVAARPNGNGGLNVRFRE